MLIRLLGVFLRPYRRALVVIALLQSAQTVASLYLPTLNADIVDNGVVVGDNGYILRGGGIMLAVSVVQVACIIVALYYSARTAMAVGHDIREALFDRIQGFSSREMGRFGTPSLVMRTTNDVQQVQMLAMMALSTAVSAPIMGVGAVVMAVNQSVGLSVLLMVVIPALGVVVAALVARMLPAYKLMQERIDEVNRVLREQISGVRVIRAFVRSDFERERFERANSALFDVSLRGAKTMGLMYPSVMAVVNLATVAVVWFGGKLIVDGSMPVGALVAFLSYLMQVLLAIMMLTFMFVMAPRAEISAARVRQVLATTPSVAPAAHPVSTFPEPGRVELRGVGLRREGAEQAVLRDIDLTAEPGETVAIIGGTGAGKSTLLSLIPRLADVTAGRVSVGGVDVRELDAAALSRAIGFVPQRSYLFSGTIASNLRFGKPDATDAELWRALEIAQAREFVERMPAGLGTPVSQGGTTVSGGQRQRLAIARALVHRPDVYLFDDSFSALDYATDRALRSALAEETARATVLMVAQRVSTVRDADRIIVLDDGRVVDVGRHDALMGSSEVYREIVLSQLTEQEAAA